MIGSRRRGGKGLKEGLLFLFGSYDAKAIFDSDFFSLLIWASNGLRALFDLAAELVELMWVGKAGFGFGFGVVDVEVSLALRMIKS